jgi:hypothetical protein
MWEVLTPLCEHLLAWLRDLCSRIKQCLPTSASKELSRATATSQGRGYKWMLSMCSLWTGDPAWRLGRTLHQCFPKCNSLGKSSKRLPKPHPHVCWIRISGQNFFVCYKAGSTSLAVCFLMDTLDIFAISMFKKWWIMWSFLQHFTFLIFFFLVHHAISLVSFNLFCPKSI